jgi:signal transduction histidine kinase
MRRSSVIAGSVALATIYFVSGKCGLSLAFVNASATPIWPPTGIALAALLLWGERLWPGVFLGAFLVNLTTQGTWLTSLGIACGNTLEAVIGVHLVVRYAGGLKTFKRAERIFRFMILAAMGSTLASATLGVTSLCLGGLASWREYGAVWVTWWLGDMMSDVVFAPVLLLWLSEAAPRLSVRRVFETAGLVVALVAVGLLVFSARGPFAYLVVLPCLWAAFRFGKRGAVTATLIMSGIALWFTLHGLGPFAGTEPNRSLLMLQAFIGTMTVTSLVLAAVISERQEAERQLAAANEELEKRVQSRTAQLRDINGQLEDFVYSIAHDLRAPLRSMHSFAKVLYSEYGARLDDTARDYTRRIEASASFMDRLLLDLLTYNRLAHSEFELSAVDVEGLWRAAVAQHEHSIREKQAHIEAVPPLPRVRAHEAALGQALANLLGNALKFVAPGVTPHVRFRAEERLENVRLWIEDNGIGISPKHHELVFRIFEQLNGKQYGGTGIGLCLVRKAVERMGGRVGLESNLGQGSRFWIELRKA